MLNDDGGKVGQNAHEQFYEPCLNLGPNQSSKDASPSQSGELKKVGEPGAISQAKHMGGSVQLLTLSVMISRTEDTPNPNMSISKSEFAEGDERITVAAAAASSKKTFLPRCESHKDQCRVCQHHTEEPLIDLGCRCRGELAKVHRSCIEILFQTKGSNKCEICQQVASNVPFPETLPSTNYWVWRVNSAHGRGQQEHRRGCCNILWVAFSLLIGGLFLDVLISVSLGISSLPVNIITGVLIVLGLAAALQLSLECCQELGTARDMQTEITINHGYHPAV